MINLIDELKEIMNFFSYGHLPHKLQEISKPFCDIAANIFDNYPDNMQKYFCLVKLLEAKDCAVRSALNKK